VPQVNAHPLAGPKLMTSQVSAADFSFQRVAWHADVTLPTWAGFQSRGGSYASQDKAAPSDGRTRLAIIRPTVSDAPLTPPELEAANWVLSREGEISTSLLQALVSDYARTRTRWAKRYRGDDFDAIMPPVHRPDDFRALIGWAAVYVHPPLRDGLAHAGFLFGCSWDPEHGLGVLMRGTSAVDFGGAEVAFCFYPENHPGA
jgi:hypothetical protein